MNIIPIVKMPTSFVDHQRGHHGVRGSDVRPWRIRAIAVTLRDGPDLSNLLDNPVRRCGDQHTYSRSRPARRGTVLPLLALIDRGPGWFPGAGD